MIFKNLNLLSKFLNRDLYKLVNQIASDGEEVLKDAIINNWYRAYPINKVYLRMGEDGGVLGATRNESSISGKTSYAHIYIKPSAIKTDIVSNNGKKFGRHQTLNGLDLRENIIDWMEEGGGIRDRQQGAHMLEQTANWVEEQISSVSNINSNLSKSGSRIELTIKKEGRVIGGK